MRRRKTYHHGNLREALLDAAIRLIAEVGPIAFTLREVARRAGVSHNAPYRHFRDRDDLMAAVGAQGYRELTQAMLEAAASETDPVERLKSAGLGYVTFALRRPEHFTVMFDAPTSKHKHPDSGAAAEQAFGTLLGFVKNCQDAGRLASGDLGQMALLAWTMVHGIAKLAITGRLP
ncbi:MAG TPA: TetR/AcrR family transcriptional regulator, partial [Candidatus Acidoferrum sp.]|nr:TetR/AcrR family transcriptional regulator [Candidatus Acidoferrum sp.]